MQGKPDLFELLHGRVAEPAPAPKELARVEAVNDQRRAPIMAVDALMADLRRMVDERDRYRATLEEIRDAVSEALSG